MDDGSAQTMATFNGVKLALVSIRTTCAFMDLTNLKELLFEGHVNDLGFKMWWSMGGLRDFRDLMDCMVISSYLLPNSHG